MRTAALIYGPHSHHLDHLAPLCQMLGIPLLLTEEEIYSQAKVFYPVVDARLCSPLDVALTLLQDHETVISCLAKTFIDQLFFFAEHALHKNILPIWCPHGNSDKGYKSGFMHYVCEENAALVYGPKMLELLTNCGVLEHLRNYIITGNYRLKDYRIHQDYYDHLATEHIGRKLAKADRTILFAPSWHDSEGTSSFTEACEILLENLPLQTNLIVKLHPNTMIQEEQLVEKLQDKYSGHAHILFLQNYPHIYSLLALCDLYIGDVSSIGYDYLTFDRPMVFLNQHNLDRNTDPSAYLFRSGIVLTPIDYPRIYTLIEELLPFDRQLFSPIRQELYRHTFDEAKKPETLSREMATMIQKIASEKIY